MATTGPTTGPTTEARAAAEFVTLQNSAIWRGVDVPRGNGRPVLLIPGLFGNDMYMSAARSWLARTGYRPYNSNILLNVGCSKRLLGSVQAALQAAIDHSNGKPIAVIGHSRGGLLAKAVTSLFPEHVSQLIVVGSPLGAMLGRSAAELEAFASFMQQDAPPARSMVYNAGRAATQLLDPNCTQPVCGCEYMTALLKPLPASVELTSIYSVSDPIVPPTSSIIAGGRNIEIDGSHSGMMFNADVFTHLAKLLGNVQ